MIHLSIICSLEEHICKLRFCYLRSKSLILCFMILLGSFPFSSAMSSVIYCFDENLSSNYAERICIANQLGRSDSDSDIKANALSIYGMSENESLEAKWEIGALYSEEDSKSILISGTEEDLIKDLIKTRVEPNNESVRNEAIRMIETEPGVASIDQVSKIYDQLTGWGGWNYYSDPLEEHFAYANETLKIFLNKTNGSVGAGDCDDFAILMSSLVGAIGGKTRVVLSNGSEGGHAYAEVYLGQLCTEDDAKILGSINWLKRKYNTDKIFVQLDPNTKEVWLNLDWNEDDEKVNHPGGPYFLGLVQNFIPLEGYRVIGPPPLRIIEIEPENPRIGEEVKFYGSEEGQWSSNLEGILCGGPVNSCSHRFKKAGRHTITLKVKGDIWPEISMPLNVLESSRLNSSK